MGRSGVGPRSGSRPGPGPDSGPDGASWFPPPGQRQSNRKRSYNSFSDHREGRGQTPPPRTNAEQVKTTSHQIHEDFLLASEDACTGSRQRTWCTTCKSDCGIVSIKLMPHM
eukprot:5833334-Pyramimonas_sp.AAC.1